MSTKFLSSFGLQKDKLITYVFDDGERIKTKYIQEALIEKYFVDKKCDFVFYATNKAKKQTWECGSECLQNHIIGKTTGEIKVISLDEVNHSNDIMKIFNTIYDSIGYKDDIYVDVTNGQRFQPMLLIMILNYATEIKKCRVRKIWYANLNNDTSEALVIDLTHFNDIYKWTVAFNSFIRYGNSNSIKQLKDNNLEVLDNEELKKSIGGIVDGLNDFTNSILNCRGRYEKNTNSSIRLSYEELRKDLDSLKNHEELKETSLAPLENVISKVNEDLAKYSFDDDVETGISTVKWCLSKGLTQQGFTALQETIITFILQSNGLNYTNYTNREKVRERISDEIYKRNVNSMTRMTNEAMKEIAISDDDKIKFLYIDEDLVLTYKKCRSLRNSINHFGYSGKSFSYEKLDRELRISYDLFLTSYRTFKRNNKH